jgi:putative lipoprotein
MFKQARNLVLPLALFFFAVIFTPALAQSTATNDSASKTVTGTVSYRQRIALPDDALVKVVIEDISYPDTPPVSIAEQEITSSGKQVPIAFAVRYDPSVLIPGHHYRILASITAHDHLLFSSTAHPVFTPGAPASVNIRVDQVAGNPLVTAPKPDHPLIGIHWRLADLNGKPVSLSMEQRPNFVLTDDGNRITGSGGCNRLMGSYELDGHSLRFKTVATTMMACLGPVMDVERKFLAALNATTAYRISGSTLQLLDDKGHALAWLHAVTEN